MNFFGECIFTKTEVGPRSMYVCNMCLHPLGPTDNEPFSSSHPTAQVTPMESSKESDQPEAVLQKRERNRTRWKRTYQKNKLSRLLLLKKVYISDVRDDTQKYFFGGVEPLKRGKTP